ncbi:DUF1310 family protein [Streptococcus parasanguinis]|uniref:DUF1310 family protein n=1 Tax=Streptococcus parasanguinis TaxID=1318 RepID=A0A6A8V6P1_STRPA|nr:DUF1310 family protein [Streptococcus parasanguinis]MTR66867.1 DUF1310 family protein [Streptococcus parasanguinis]MTR99782.1 DUF1310 family protein [Streptococcus parasanguinis]MTS01645.1 DUF1310 family protein [Streptococcus parasanguinis]MTS11436.1 DUF1310 family protein [Streptococcus parasanguinis]
MKKSKFIVLVMILFGLSLGGCSLFTDKAAERREMIQIAESKKAKDVIENLLRQEDPNAFTDKGVIKSYKINENSLKYNPMGGLIIKVIINDDNNLTITTTLTEESDGKFEQNGYVISGELSDELRGK